jgi:hypothetical protein
MKNSIHRNPIAALALTGALCASLAAPALAADENPYALRLDGPVQEQSESPADAAGPDTFAGEGKQSYWGVGLGYVFNKVPVSMSTFNVFMSNLWYSHVFGDPNDQTRIAGTLGLYGFQLLLPVPRASVDFYLGKPSQTVQFKGGIGGFYDVAVGGHAGVNGELGVVLKNRVDISFMAVPFGKDSERSYAEFMGLKSEEEALEDYKDANNQWVEMPYYGIFVGLRF